MAEPVWHKFLGKHSSCCGIHVLTAVRGPEMDDDGASFYGRRPDGGYGFPTDHFDATKWDEALAEGNPMDNDEEGDWDHYFRAEPQKRGMMVLRWLAPEQEVPAGYKIIGSNSSGRIVGAIS